MPRATRDISSAGIAAACAALLTVCLLAACAENSSPPEYAGGAPPSAVEGVSRVIIAADGGQTIPVPKLMDDAYTLWSSPGKEMGRMNFPEDKRAAVTRGLGQGEPLMAMAGWLSADQRNVAEQYLYRLTEGQRGLTMRVLARSEQYLPDILEILRRKGLPAELASLPMVESAFQSGAVSPSGAAGLWQLMPATARRFGLKVNRETDERFDPVKATEAAADYLASLYRQFQDWPLAIAAYNCGEGAMRKALAQTNSADLAGLSAQCRLAPRQSPLAEETLNFVPAFAAAVEVMSKSTELKLSAVALLLPQHERGDQRLEPLAPQPGGDKLRLQGDYAPQPWPEARPQQSVRIP